MFLPPMNVPEIAARCGVSCSASARPADKVCYIAAKKDAGRKVLLDSAKQNFSMSEQRWIAAKNRSKTATLLRG